MTRALMTVYVRADGCQDLGNGLVEIHVPVTPVTPEESDVLARRFPHTENEIEHLLQTEALLASIVPNKDIYSFYRDQFPDQVPEKVKKSKTGL